LQIFILRCVRGKSIGYLGIEPTTEELNVMLV
jgi:hypothetical protein